MNTRFYFHLSDGEQYIFDRTGLDSHRDVATSHDVLKMINERWPSTANIGLWKGWSAKIVDAAGCTIRVVALDEGI